MDAPMVVLGLQLAIAKMEESYQAKTFFTSYMVVRCYKCMFPKPAMYNWEVRKHIRQPFFYLDDRKGWRRRIRSY